MVGEGGYDAGEVRLSSALLDFFFSRWTSDGTDVEGIYGGVLLRGKEGEGKRGLVGWMGCSVLFRINGYPIDGR